MVFQLGWPQIIVMLLTVIGLTVALLQHGEPRPARNFWLSLGATAVQLGLLYWGGFFS